ncbi:MAG: (d)CMP kinase [Lachnospiraceae bacterium]|nr:(d)CMP kinase [Lachnospiraceae bacterium]
MNNINIAIDGPAGAGKSTIAKKIAAELDYIYIDTGAMYRAMALYFLRAGVQSSDEETISAKCGEIEIGIEYLCGVQHVFLNNEDVSGFIRTDEVGAYASACSVYSAVRTKLVELQRKLAANENVVMDGRDIASVVLPNADVKVYLTASVEERARRRYNEYVLSGQECDFDRIKQEIEERDYRDMHRDNSPLVCVEEATVVDSSDMTIDEVCEQIMNLAKVAAASKNSGI